MVTISGCSDVQWLLSADVLMFSGYYQRMFRCSVVVSAEVQMFSGCISGSSDVQWFHQRKFRCSVVAISNIGTLENTE